VPSRSNIPFREPITALLSRKTHHRTIDKSPRPPIRCRALILVRSGPPSNRVPPFRAPPVFHLPVPRGPLIARPPPAGRSRPGSPLASPSTEFRLDEFDRVTFRAIDSAMVNPYQSPEAYEEAHKVLAAQHARLTRTDAVSPSPAAASAAAKATAGLAAHGSVP